MKTETVINTDTAPEVLEWVRSAKDFAVEQAPLVAQEIISWGTTIHTVGLIFFGLIALLAAVMMVLCVAESLRNNDDDAFGVGMVFLFASLASAIPTCVNAYILIKIHTAPRMYLIEQLSGMLN